MHPAFPAVRLEAVLVVTPADQTVTDEAAYAEALRQAVRLAADGLVVILGITPDAPETGYGYIRTLPELGIDESLRGEVLDISAAIRNRLTLARMRRVLDFGE